MSTMQCALVVDDLPAVRAGFVELLRESYPTARIFEAGRSSDAMQILQRESIDLLLVDLGLPDGSGVELIRTLAELRPQARSVVVTIFDDDDHLFPALQAGAFGYLLKDRPKVELRAQLRRIQDGEPPLSPSIARRMVQHFSHEGIRNFVCEAYDVKKEHVCQAGRPRRRQRPQRHVCRPFPKNSLSSSSAAR